MMRPLLPTLTTFALLAAAAAPAAGNPAERSPWVGLAEGRIGDVTWSVQVARPSGDSTEGRRVPGRPCLRVGTKLELNDYDYQRSKYQGCTDASTHLAATQPPLIVSGAQASSGMRVKLTAVGIVVAPAARLVQVTLDDGSQATIPLKQLSSEQEQRARLGSIRYAAFAVRGTWSVQRLVTQSRSGRTLWDSAAE